MKSFRIKNQHFFIMIFGICFFLCNCNNVRNNKDINIINFTQAQQKFTIVPFYENIPTYIIQAHHNKSQIDKVYKDYIYNPIWYDFASNGECAFLARNIKNPIRDLETLDKEFRLLSGSGVEEIVKDALLTVSRELPGPNTTVYIQVMDPAYKKMIPEYAKKILDMGIHADTYGTGKIFVAIDPRARNWKNILPRIIAHEYHHSIWISRNFETVHFSLLDCLIIEGRAEGFADRIYPNIEAPWPDLTAEDEYRIWNYMKTVLHNKDERLILEMTTGNKEIPFLSVYSIGYKIIQEFLKNNPQVPILEWTDYGPEKILKKSKYEDKFSQHLDVKTLKNPDSIF
jgi:uncharacterized protein YjaZ